MVEKKLFGYPTFDENGEEILSTYDNEYRDMLMDVRLYRMAAGSTREFCREGEEIAVLLLSGEITFKWAEGEKTVSRKDVFTEGPWALHVSGGKQITVTEGVMSMTSAAAASRMLALADLLQTAK